MRLYLDLLTSDDVSLASSWRLPAPRVPVAARLIHDVEGPVIVTRQRWPWRVLRPRPYRTWVAPCAVEVGGFALYHTRTGGDALVTHVLPTPLHLDPDGEVAMSLTMRVRLPQTVTLATESSAKSKVV